METKHKVHKSLVFKQSLSYVFLSKNRTKKEKGKRSQSLDDETIFIYVTTFIPFQLNEFKTIDARCKSVRSRWLHRHRNDCGKVLSKIITPLRLPRSVICLKISRQILNQWEAKQNQWDFVCVIFLTVWASRLVHRSVCSCCDWSG